MFDCGYISALFTSEYTNVAHKYTKKNYTEIPSQKKCPQNPPTKSHTPTFYYLKIFVAGTNLIKNLRLSIRSSTVKAKLKIIKLSIFAVFVVEILEIV